MSNRPDSIPGGAGASRARSGDRQDGITQMSGSASFGSASLALQVDVSSGSTVNTSSYGATAAEGDTIPANANYQAATLSSTNRNGQTVWSVSCGTLPRAALNQDYTIQVKYVLTGNDNRQVTKYLKGTIAANKIATSGSTPITLS
jgi:hypothetical protein